MAASLRKSSRNVENAARLVIVENFRFSQSQTKDGQKLGINFVLISPYLYVESDAITDDPIDLDIGDGEFLELINKIKNLKHYDPYEIDLSIPVEETPVEEEGALPVEEGTPVEGEGTESPMPENPVEEVLTGEGGGDSIFPQ